MPLALLKKFRQGFVPIAAKETTAVGGKTTKYFANIIFKNHDDHRRKKAFVDV
jgi:hypothetical protein